MRRFIKGLRWGEKGFTLIELLIVVAILGILAAVIIPNLSAFMTTGNLNAANTELENVKSASLAYYADNSAWPTTSDALVTGKYLSGALKAVYSFDGGSSGTGFVTGASVVSGGWPTTIVFTGGSTSGHGKWVKAP
jgi:prepilin-type N-terminal cleavage/methylation domain-containing protein